MFLINKKIAFSEKIWQQKFNSIKFDKEYFLLIKQNKTKQKKIKTTKTYLNETMAEKQEWQKWMS